MKRFVVSLMTSILAFTAGLITASSWTSRSEMHRPVIISPACPPSQPRPEAPLQSYSVSPAGEFEFGQNGLKLVPERVQLKSESLNYDIDVSYPQILIRPHVDGNRFRKVNQHIKDTATKLYHWPLDPSTREPLLAGGRNTVNFTYQVGLATDSFLSVTFVGYSYDASSGGQLQDSFSVSYDLTTGKNIKLSELFKPGSNYLEIISRYCTKELSKDGSRKTIEERLMPIPENFQNWQIRTSGIEFNFYACKVVDCADGDQNVNIPFDSLRSVLNPDIPSKFNITYP